MITRFLRTAWPYNLRVTLQPTHCRGVKTQRQNMLWDSLVLNQVGALRLRIWTRRMH